jgi:hypothetical protein
VLRPTANPAANAPLASATPLFGSPAAGTVIPGRYVVFFHSNVSSTKIGLNRWVVFGGCRTGWWHAASFVASVLVDIEVCVQTSANTLTAYAACSCSDQAAPLNPASTHNPPS